MKLATLCYVRREERTLMVYRNKKANDMHLAGVGSVFSRQSLFTAMAPWRIVR